MIQMPMIKPYLQARDLEITQRWYEEVLGFKKVYQWPAEGKPELIELENDRAKLMFFKTSEGEPCLTGALNIIVGGIREYHARLRGRAAITDIKESEAEGAFFSVTDPNGYFLEFREPVERHRKSFGIG